MKKIDILGKKFNRLTPIEEVGRDNRGEILWRCKCDCGNVIVLASSRIRNGVNKSCGCFRREIGYTKNYTHGGTKVGKHDRLYGVYRDIIARTESPNAESYKYYGERGIKMCKEWRDDYAAFRKWALTNGYDDQAPRCSCTIDRIDVNGNYEPDNCRWVGMDVQNRNKRNETMQRALAPTDTQLITLAVSTDEELTIN